MISPEGVEHQIKADGVDALKVLGWKLAPSEGEQHEKPKPRRATAKK